MSIEFKKELNPEQYLAATSDSKYLRIIAGAGTGKTRTLTYRLAYLITRGDLLPNQIAAITFTNKAAKEMAERVNKLLSDRCIGIAYSPTICTFHSFCLRFLRGQLTSHYSDFKPNFSIADEDDQKSIFKKIGEEMGYLMSDDLFKEAIGIVHRLKSHGYKYDGNYFIKEESKEGLVYNVFKSYQNKLAERNMLDFDDILIFTKEILENDKRVRDYYSMRYKVFMIDEFQDTDKLQYDIVRLFMNSECELCVVGDPDQTIYTWRGADDSLITSQLAKDFHPLKTISLIRNYRSDQNILDVANKLIANNPDREDKSLIANSSMPGEKVHFLSYDDEEQQAFFIAKQISRWVSSGEKRYSDIALIYRSNYMSRAVETMFKRFSIPYDIYGGIRFYEREEVKSALAYLRVLINPYDDLSFSRLIKFPRLGIGDVSFEKLELEAKSRGLAMVDYIVSSYPELPLNKTVIAKLSNFVSAYKRAKEKLNKKTPVIEDNVKIVDDYFNESGLINYYEEIDKKEAKEGESGERVSNIHELVSDYQAYLKRAFSVDDEEEMPFSLSGFLLNVVLLSAQDDIVDDDKVLLMTGHVAKGLEFNTVFAISLVDGLFPTNHAIQDASSKKIEEERRLLYVILTRAKKSLYITTYRGMRYGGQDNLPSRFLPEIDFVPENYEVKHSFKMTYQGSYIKTDKASIKSPSSNVFSNRYSAIKAPNISHLKKANSSSDVEYNVGDKIAHTSFGLGVVTRTEGKYIYVEFENIGEKKLVKGFPLFKKVE